MSIIDLQLVSTGKAEPIGMPVDGHHLLIADAQRAGNNALSRLALVPARKKGRDAVGPATPVRR
jgi:hypothetical protein